MTNVDKIHDLIGKIDRILDKFDDAESNLESFNDDLHRLLKRTKRSNKGLKEEIESGISGVDDGLENVGIFKKSLNQFIKYLENTLDELADGTSSDLISELNKILKRYRYVKRGLALIAEYEELKREEIDTNESDNVDQLNELTDEADQIYEDFYDDSDDFGDKDEEVDDSDDEEEDDSEDEALQRELDRYQSLIKQILERTDQLRENLSKHNQWIIDSNNNIVKGYNRYVQNFSEGLYNECNTIFRGLDSFMENAKAFIKLFDAIEKCGRDGLDYPDKYNWQEVINYIQKTNKRYDFIEKGMEYTEEYTKAAGDEIDDETDAHVSRMDSYSNAVEEIMKNYFDNSDEYGQE